MYSATAAHAPAAAINAAPGPAHAPSNLDTTATAAAAGVTHSAHFVGKATPAAASDTSLPGPEAVRVPGNAQAAPNSMPAADYIQTLINAQAAAAPDTATAASADCYAFSSDAQAATDVEAASADAATAVANAQTAAAPNAAARKSGGQAVGYAQAAGAGSTAAGLYPVQPAGTAQAPAAPLSPAALAPAQPQGRTNSPSAGAAEAKANLVDAAWMRSKQAIGGGVTVFVVLPTLLALRVPVGCWAAGVLGTAACKRVLSGRWQSDKVCLHFT